MVVSILLIIPLHKITSFQKRDSKRMLQFFLCMKNRKKWIICNNRAKDTKLMTNTSLSGYFFLILFDLLWVR